jgi:hypothetical protein
LPDNPRHRCRQRPPGGIVLSWNERSSRIVPIIKGLAALP